MTKFMRDLRSGMVIGFKAALTVYTLMFFGVVLFFAPIPFMFCAGDTMTGAMDIIWGVDHPWDDD